MSGNVVPGARVEVSAKEMKRMRDAGMTYAQIAKIVDKGPDYVRDTLDLVEQEEWLLIEGVEEGLFSLLFAMRLAQADDSSIRDVVLAVLDEELGSRDTVKRIKRLLEQRMKSS